MINILKKAIANVKVSDELGNIKFKGSNLFLASGRKFIADTLIGSIINATINPALYACDLGDNATLPSVDDIDLTHYVSPLSIAVNTPAFPSSLAGSSSGIRFQFIYTNNTGSDITVRELGLFYRANSINFPLRNSLSDPGYMLAHLKTTANYILIASTRSITIDWKIIF